jgi:hypothetical protein
MTDAMSADDAATRVSTLHAANITGLGAVADVSRLFKTLDIPTTPTWATALGPQLLNADLLRAASPSSQLSKVLAAFGPQRAAMDSVLKMARLIKTLDLPTQKWAATLGPQLATADLLRAAGPSSQLSKALAAFAPNRQALDAIAALGLARQSATFSAQIGQIVSSQDSIVRLVLRSNAQLQTTGLFNTLGRYGHVQAQLGALTTGSDPAILLRGLSRISGRRYDSYLDGLPARPIARRVAVAEAAGDTQSGLLIAESLTADGLSNDRRQELAETFTTVSLEPWQNGPADARDELFAALAELDPELPDWLKAAWDDIVRDGPKGASKIANCAVECIDQTLRVMAAVEDVAAWIAQVGPKSGWIDDKNRPTRRAKIMFVMRHRSERDAKLAVAQVEALATLVHDVMGNLQSVKHGKAPTMAIMRGWVQATEGALSQLLLHR